jgi:cellulose synthase (UDP-forming)
LITTSNSHAQTRDPVADAPLADMPLADMPLADTPLTGPTLAGTRVTRIWADGPAIGTSRQRRRLRPDTFDWALARRDRAVVAALSVGWLGCLALFWYWWLAPGHWTSTFGLAVNSAVLAYISGFPIFFIGAANRLRRVRRGLPVPPLAVAFVVTRAPSEPWPVVMATLSAMLGQDYPHPYDVWLCDEQPTPEIADWCARQRVGLSTRYGVPAYHRATWPRRTKCKEGNLAYFYDQVGYDSYDVVAQLDCDHVPAPSYLAEMVRPFADPAVGYVAAPSVCDANASQSWSARGRLYKEATFHGPFQLGHSDGLGPLCIGSHYAVRTAALREIGGVGPELAEDFSTTFLLSSAGWHGAFAIDAEAHGLGPDTFAAMAVQEFQWSRSLTTLLLGLVPRNILRLRWQLRLRFLYAMSYYGLLVGTTVLGLLLPPVATLTGRPWVHVNYGAFLLHWWAVSAWLIALTVLLRRRELLRPANAPVLSWENWLYSVARWPYVALGIGAAGLMALRPREVALKVTPKDRGRLERLPLRLTLPFAALSIGCTAAALYGERASTVPGYVFLSMLAGLVYAVVATAVPALHVRDSAAACGTSLVSTARATVAAPLLLAAIAAAPAIGAVTLFPGYAMKAFGW